LRKRRNRTTVIAGKMDPDGFPISAARLCMGSGSTERCYTPEPPKEPSPPFGLNAKAQEVKLLNGARLVLFTAESFAGGSDSLIALALVADKGDQLINLLPAVALPIQSEYRLWKLPSISAMPIRVTAEYVWMDGEPHYAPHHYRIKSYVYDKQAERYEKRDQFATKEKYAGLDDADTVRVLEPERKNIGRRLRAHQKMTP
jgi:hypothetical protein